MRFLAGSCDWLAVGADADAAAAAAAAAAAVAIHEVHTRNMHRITVNLFFIKLKYSLYMRDSTPSTTVQTSVPKCCFSSVTASDFPGVCS